MKFLVSVFCQILTYNSTPGGSGILAFILPVVLLLQGWYVLKIPSKLKHDSKKKEGSRKTVRKKEKIGERKREQEANWRRLKKFRANWRK